MIHTQIIYLYLDSRQSLHSILLIILKNNMLIFGICDYFTAVITLKKEKVHRTRRRKYQDIGARVLECLPTKKYIEKYMKERKNQALLPTHYSFLRASLYDFLFTV